MCVLPEDWLLAHQLLCLLLLQKSNAWQVAGSIAACRMACDLYILHCFLYSFSYFLILANLFWSSVVPGLTMVSSLAAPGTGTELFKNSSHVINFIWGIQYICLFYNFFQECILISYSGYFCFGFSFFVSIATLVCSSVNLFFSILSSLY